MPFAAALRKSLQDRGSEVPAEFERGDSLEDILNRHLRTVEQMGGDDLFTCVLLLSPDGKRLSVGAAPSFPETYCRVGDSFEVDLSHGSCAAAAYLGRPVYAVDIETDPNWADYSLRDVALQHGFRSCWSTPIRDLDGAIVGTFAILHRAVGMPTSEEVEAIELITWHVAEAIMRFRGPQPAARPDRYQSGGARLKLVFNNPEVRDPAARLVALAEKLHAKATDLEGYADRTDSEADAQVLRVTVELSRELSAKIMLQIGPTSSEKADR